MRLSLLLLALVLFWSGCSSSNVTVEYIGLSSPDDRQLAVDYPTFWDAAACMDIAGAGALRPTPDQEWFLRALSRVERCEFDSAISEFRRIGQRTQDTLTRQRATRIYSDLLFAQSRWKELQRRTSDTAAPHGAGDALIDAFSTLPPESISFPPDAQTLPLSLSVGNTPMVEIFVNGHPKRFWIDTGAGLSVVASDVALECGVRRAGSDASNAWTGTNLSVVVHPAVIDELRIGEVVLRNHPSMIIGKEDLEYWLLGIFRILKIDGIIGWNAISRMDMECDYTRKVLIIRRPVERSVGTRNFFWLGYPVVRLQSADGTPLLFGLDTGAKGSSITDNILAKIEDVSSRTSSRTIWSAGGSERIGTTVLERLSLFLDAYRIRIENAETMPPLRLGFLRLDGLIGCDVLKEARFRIDPMNGRFEYSLPGKK